RQSTAETQSAQRFFQFCHPERSEGSAVLGDLGVSAVIDFRFGTPPSVILLLDLRNPYRR
ncbi:MAG TPA: hypothetical protein VKI40_09095, partial [Terriglobales bacterium]|nr:hypothetical protein [Terriglobales bacterium]